MANSEATQIIPAAEIRLPWGLPRWQMLALAALTVWLYAAIVRRLVLQWVGPNADPNFEHGIFVPLFSILVLWQDRQRLRTIPTSSSWVGLPLVLVSLVMLVLGILGAELFFSRVSLLVLMAGLILLFQGKEFFRAVLFPWAFLILMIPIPNIILQQVTFPLQLLASRVASGLLEVVGVPVLRQGNTIQLAKLTLDVAEACSGIRSLLTLVTLAIIYGYLMETRVWVRVLLAVLAVPIAVVANSFRIFGTGMLVQFWSPDKAEGFFHGFEGWLIFVVALILLFLVHRLICWIWKRKPSLKESTSSAATREGLENGRASASASAKLDSARPSQLSFVLVAALMLMTAVGLQARSRAEYIPSPTPLSALPMRIDGWTATDIPMDERTLEILGPGNYLLRDYDRESAEGSAAGSQALPVNLYIAYFPSQRTNDTIHSPDHCLPGAGWIPVSRERVALTGAGGESFTANRYVVSKLGDRQLALYWFQAHGRAVASEYDAKYRLIWDSITMNRSDGALVRLMTPMFDGESADAAQARIMGLGSHVIPMLDTYIPR